MPQTFDLVLANGTVVNHDGAFPRDVGVRDGRIAGIGDLSADSAGERIDCKGLHVLPGVIDSQVHFREPGPVHKEDLETGSRAAVLGGVTAVFEMPNTDPPTTNAEALADKMRRAKGRMHCHFAFWVGATHDNVADIPELERLPGAAGIKVFMGSSTGRLLVADDEGVLAILKQIRRRAAFHSEDEARLNERKGLRVAGDPSSHPLWRDEIAALRSTERLVRLAREARAQVHVLHVSTREEMEFLTEAKDVATCEATPHHLTLSADDYSRLGTRLQMNPPVRAAKHRESIWRGLEQGVVERSVEALRRLAPGHVRAVLGPCIHAAHYEFGLDLLERLATRFGAGVVARTATGAPALDIPATVRAALRAAGVDDLDDVDVCTASSADYFSYRRDGTTGRQAMLVVRGAARRGEDGP